MNLKSTWKTNNLTKITWIKIFQKNIKDLKKEDTKISETEDHNNFENDRNEQFSENKSKDKLEYRLNEMKNLNEEDTKISETENHNNFENDRNEQFSEDKSENSKSAETEKDLKKEDEKGIIFNRNTNKLDKFEENLDKELKKIDEEFDNIWKDITNFEVKFGEEAKTCFEKRLNTLMVRLDELRARLNLLITKNPSLRKEKEYFDRYCNIINELKKYWEEIFICRKGLELRGEENDYYKKRKIDKHITTAKVDNQPTSLITKKDISADIFKDLNNKVISATRKYPVMINRIERELFQKNKPENLKLNIVVDYKGRLLDYLEKLKKLINDKDYIMEYRRDHKEQDNEISNLIVRIQQLLERINRTYHLYNINSLHDLYIMKDKNK